LPVDEITRVKFKVCVVGDRAVGKTSLLNRYVFNCFDPQYRGTLGASLRYLNVQEAVSGRHLVEAETAFFDLMGEKGVRDNFKEILFWGTQGFLAVADVTRPETIRSLSSWIYAVQGVAGDIPYRILMNKSDLTANVSISPEATALLLKEFPGVPYHLTSAKTSAGVERAFEALIDTMVDVALRHSKVRRESKIIGDRVLAFAKRRGTLGISKKDILANFKDLNVDLLMREVNDLQTLGLATVELMGPASFRLKITPKGEQELERILAPERVREDTE
jgi:small GTP-binding protein